MNSLGAWGHFDIPLGGGFNNNGTIVESGYHIDNINQHWSFTFTTMRTPLDEEHPVAGNRRFGIKTDPNGGYMFYICGVDRVWGSLPDKVNYFSGIAFDNADAMWENVQVNNLLTFINSVQRGGTANLYTPERLRIRVNWPQVQQFLTNPNYTIQDFKNALGCP